MDQGQNKRYIEAAMDWLCHAQDVSKDGGVAGWYSFRRGWSPSYPETTGYIIPNFFEYYKKTQDEQYRKRAVRMADWLVSIQMPSGAFQSHVIGSKPEPRVFNTGMILFGLVRAFVETNDEKYLRSAKRAGNFLVGAQDDDGAWRKYAYNGFAHSYYSRVSWGLLALGEAAGDGRYIECARKNLNWALTNMGENFWFENTAFEKGKNPYTHTIAYLLEGLLESGDILKESRYIGSAIGAAERLMRVFESRRFMPGDFDQKWRGNFNYTCLTGDAQISIVWQKIYSLTGDARFLNASLKMNDHLKAKQMRFPVNAVRGGISGSYPIWGAYHPFWLPSWAAKFFIDALSAEDEIMAALG